MSNCTWCHKQEATSSILCSTCQETFPHCETCRILTYCLVCGVPYCEACLSAAFRTCSTCSAITCVACVETHAHAYSFEPQTDPDEQASHPTKKSRVAEAIDLEEVDTQELLAILYQELEQSGYAADDLSFSEDQVKGCSPPVDPREFEKATEDRCEECDDAVTALLQDLSRWFGIPNTFESFDDCYTECFDLKKFFDSSQRKMLETCLSGAESVAASRPQDADLKEVGRLIQRIIDAKGALSTIWDAIHRALQAIGLDSFFRDYVDAIADPGGEDSITRRVEGRPGKKGNHAIILYLGDNAFQDDRRMMSTLAHECTHVAQLDRMGTPRTVQDMNMWEVFGYQTELRANICGPKERKDAEKRRSEFFFKLKPSRRRWLLAGNGVSGIGETQSQEAVIFLSGLQERLLELEAHVDECLRLSGNERCCQVRKDVVSKSLTYVMALLEEESQPDVPITPWSVPDHQPPAVPEHPIPS
jgi:hypothetical protein